MLTEYYVKALPADPDPADQVFELWDVGMIPDDLSDWAWWLIQVGSEY